MPTSRCWLLICSNQIPAGRRPGQSRAARSRCVDQASTEHAGDDTPCGGGPPGNSREITGDQLTPGPRRRMPAGLGAADPLGRGPRGVDNGGIGGSTVPTTVELELVHPQWMQVSPGKLHGLAYQVFAEPACDIPTRAEPFTIWPPYAGPAAGRSGLRLTWLRDDGFDLSARIRQVPVRFGSITCTVVSTRDRRVPYTRLAGSAPTRRLLMEFHSPTLFSRNGKTWPVPDPTLVLRGLWQRWNEHATTHALDEPALRELLTLIEVRDLNVRTVQVAAGRAGQSVGFVGVMTLALPRTSPPHTQLLLGVLGAAAEFLGVGKQTTYGFGVVTGQAE